MQQGVKKEARWNQPQQAAAPAQPHLKRVLSLWDLIYYGIILTSPIAAVPLFGEAQVLSHGHAVTTLLLAMIAMSVTAVSFGRMASRLSLRRFRLHLHQPRPESESRIHRRLGDVPRISFPANSKRALRRANRSTPDAARAIPRARRHRHRPNHHSHHARHQVHRAHRRNAPRLHGSGHRGFPGRSIPLHHSARSLVGLVLDAPRLQSRHLEHSSRSRRNIARRLGLHRIRWRLDPRGGS